MILKDNKDPYSHGMDQNAKYGGEKHQAMDQKMAVKNRQQGSPA